MLVNAELGVNEAIAVEIRSGGSESIDRDYSDRVKKPDPVPEPKKDPDPGRPPEGSGSGKKRDGTINPFKKP